MPRSLVLSSADGVSLEGELSLPAVAPSAACVLCHPHPSYGGTMRSLVISELFASLPDAGIACLRFNFRGVEASGGSFDEGNGERLDVVAALERMAGTPSAPGLAPGIPLVALGWSFGADMALASVTSDVTAWVGIAAPLRFAENFAAETDPRPKRILLAEHDEFQAPDIAGTRLDSWVNTSVTVVPGASHHFVGRTDRLVHHVREFVNTLVR